MTEPIYHLALASDWKVALAAGEYTTSTLGRTLAEEGFIHASRADQWQGVRAAFYAGVTEPLVLLVIDPDRLACELRVEAVPGTGDEFPHLYGPLNTDAVVEVRRSSDAGNRGSRTSMRPSRFENSSLSP